MADPKATNGSNIDNFEHAWLFAGREQIRRVRCARLLPKSEATDWTAIKDAMSIDDQASAMLHFYFPLVLKAKVTRWYSDAGKYHFFTSDGIKVTLGETTVSFRDKVTRRRLSIRITEDRWLYVVKRRQILSHQSDCRLRHILVAYNTFQATRDKESFWTLPS